VPGLRWGVAQQRGHLSCARVSRFLSPTASGWRTVHGPSPDISHAVRSADFQVCCIAGFQTRRAPEPPGRPPTWPPSRRSGALARRGGGKSATQQAWKPALPARAPSAACNS
jgi:hypothetical protein